LNQNHAFVNYRRAAELPLRLRNLIIAGIEHAEFFLPENLARHVECVQSFRTQHGNKVSAVCRECGIRVRGFRMPLDFRHTRENGPVESDTTRVFIQADNFPRMRCVVLN
jgi:hypothetical protein